MPVAGKARREVEHQAGDDRCGEVPGLRCGSQHGNCGAGPDMWSPRTDPRIVLREHEPNGDSTLRLNIVKPHWLREAQRFWLHTALDTRTMVWTSIKSRLFYVGGVFGNFCDERGIDDPLLTRDVELRPILSDFNDWMRRQPSRRNGRCDPITPTTRDGVRSAVQSFYTFMFDERSSAAKETGDQRWLDLTPGYTNLWRPYDHERVPAQRRHVSRGRFIEPEDLRRMISLIEIIGAPKGESVEVSLNGGRRTFPGLGDEQVMRAWMIQQLTGRRASEILMMDHRPLEPLSGCSLVSTGEPDEVIARVRYQQTKVPGVDNTILVDRTVVRIVAEQQAWVRGYLQLGEREPEPRYLFIQQVRNTRGHYPRALSSYNRPLRRLDQLVQLTDRAGQPLAFSQSHRLRLQGGWMVLDGKLEDLLSRHRVLVGPGLVTDTEMAWLPAAGVIEIRRTPRQTTVLLDRPVPGLPTGWAATDPTLDELVVAYLRVGQDAPPVRTALTSGQRETLCPRPTVPGPLQEGLHQQRKSVGHGRVPAGMWWVAWRQHRAQLAISLGVIAVVAVALGIFRMLLVARLQELIGGDFAECDQLDSAGRAPQCSGQVYGLVTDEFGNLRGLLGMGLLVLPVILGAFVGAPMFAREFEQHTQVYALTQSVGRLRWWASKVTVAGVPVVLAMLGPGLLMEWAIDPFVVFIAQPMDTPKFETLGIIPAAFTALTIAVAITAGIALRSTVIALAVSIIVAGVVVAALALIRPHLLTPERFVTPIEGTSLFYSDSQSWYLGSGYIDATGAPIDFNGPCPNLDNAPATTTAEEARRLWVDCQRAQGITSGYVDYLPADRRTALQLVVTGICAILTALFLAAGAFRLHRRVL